MLLKIELIKDFIQTAGTHTTNAIQSIHSVVADGLYQIASQHEPIADKVKVIKQNHDQAASEVYAAIHNINHALGELVSDYIEAAEDGLHANKVINENDKVVKASKKASVTPKESE